MTTAAAPTQVTYKGELYNIIGTTGGLVRIQPSGEEDDFHAFWVPAGKVKPVVERKREAACGPAHAVLVAASDIEHWGHFVQYLNSVGYSLSVAVRDDGFDAATDEYRAWAGEDISLDRVKLTQGLILHREWRLSFKLKDGTECPFPIDIAGTGPQRPTSTPRGLLQDGNRVTVYFAKIVEKLVRAGLRA